MIEQRGRGYRAVASFTQNGKRTRLTRSFRTREQAEAWLEQTLRPVQRIEYGTMADLLGRCLALDWQGQDGVPQRIARRLCQEGLGGLSPAQIDAEYLDRLLLAWRGKGRGASTCRQYLSALKVMLRRAERLGWIERLPLFPETRTLRLPEPRSLVLREEWVLALVDELEQREQRHEAGLTLFLYHIGCRVSEALNLEWDHITERHITFVKTKARKARRIPIPSIVEPLLRKGLNKPFPVEYSNYHKRYSSAVETVCDRLGLGVTVRQQWVIHTLRHTCLTNLAQKGWSAPQLMAWSGHHSLSMAQRYIHSSAVNLDALVD